VSGLLDLYLWLVHFALRIVDRAVEGLGLRGGLLDRFLDWLAGPADVALAAIVAAIGLAVYAALAGAVFSWLDRRVRARAEGRLGPRYWGVGGLMQGWADWAKLLVRRPLGDGSAAWGALSGALVIGALALLPAGGWLGIVDPGWGVPVAAALLALAPLPLAAAAPPGTRARHICSVAASGAVLLLAVASSVMIAGDGSGSGLVSFQSRHLPLIVLSPLAFALFMYAYWVEAGRLHAFRWGPPGESPGPRVAIARYAMDARHFALALLGAVVFLGGWWGPLAWGSWWTLAKALALAASASFLSAALPTSMAPDVPRDVRARWLPLAAINLVVVAVVLEVMA
jgi:NADH-quinone oxidoreductase subunit H